MTKPMMWQIRCVVREKLYDDLVEYARLQQKTTTKVIEEAIAYYLFRDKKVVK